MFFDGAVNTKGVGIRAILISPTGQHYPATTRLRFFCINNTTEYEACIMGMNMAIDQDVKELLIMGDSDLIIRQAQGEWETRDVKLFPYKQHMEYLSKRFKSIEFRKLLPKRALYLGDIEGNNPETAVNADAVKKGIMSNPSAAIALSDWDDEGFHSRYPKQSNLLLTP
ncbi:uncharacterized protein [Nicotiana sylvestris]|uniref:uncharacterized protein n=1 Tax=Nicotiana sylvestris TaxID=4096 RepID=UPI00388CCA2E